MAYFFKMQHKKNLLAAFVKNIHSEFLRLKNLKWLIYKTFYGFPNILARFTGKILFNIC